MDSLLKSDIFFFITSVSVVFLTILLIIAIIFTIKILKDVLYISHKVREESDRVIEDIGFWRRSIKKSGAGIVGLASSFLEVFGLGFRSKRVKKSKNEKNKKEE